MRTLMVTTCLAMLIVTGGCVSSPQAKLYTLAAAVPQERV